MEEQRIGFIGAGKVGTALSAMLSGAGYPVIAVSSKNVDEARRLADRVPGCLSFETAQEVVDNVEHVFITTPDDIIFDVVSGLRWRPDQYVVHCSGVSSTDILEPARELGAMVGSFHPCQAFPGIEQAIKNLPGSTFAIEAENPLLDILQDMASSIGCDWIVLKPGDKTLYHAAAVFVSNYYVALLQIAANLFQKFDIPTTRATKILMPLMQGNLSNMRNIGLPDCLTGPISRGDIKTIEKHISALKETDGPLLNIYAELGLQTIPIALEKGTLDEQAGETLQRILKAAIETEKQQISSRKK
jgi:predicted short-subunit dehydrogenase-like oxidoreductase (DUF2520 family)